MTELADRINVLRDEVLDTVEQGDRDLPGAEVFEAVVRQLAALGDSSGHAGIDLTLHDAIARRLAWGDTEEAVLGDADRVFERLVKAVQRALRDPDDQIAVLETASDVLTAAARIVALSAVGRAGRDRSARLREELAQRRLREALTEQQTTLARLEQELKDSGL
ncbi:MAG: hypothetical protein H6709_19985 [Kofleriaceae bacterium]|nr:hypothetical protein [Myxococcales bacterium]MCB9561324.1 hypothetical protein [Kofleriaceae bacterium]MCB9574367.1 hypothetical protein [Kofleriaceae bacterium]